MHEINLRAEADPAEYERLVTAAIGDPAPDCCPAAQRVQGVELGRSPDEDRIHPTTPRPAPERSLREGNGGVHESVREDG